jgi:ppGpp synthetase/RelA/SpoT-type nucleotidyltranferase
MSLTETDVLLLVGRYEEQRQTFERLATSAHTAMAGIVEPCKVRHMITHRAKGAASFRRKLWNNRENHVLADFDESLSPPIKDLAAVRVLLYLPDDIETVVSAIQSHFFDHGHAVKPSDKRSGDMYSAYHFHMDCAGDGLVVGDAPTRSVFEIQVCTVTAHLWNELEHDIIYKQPLGRPDAAQSELLVALHGELMLASRTANRLMIHTNKLIGKNTAPIRDAESLQHYLQARAEGVRVRGDFAALFDLLSGLLEFLTSAALHNCFLTGTPEKRAKEIAEEFDPNGSLYDVGAILVQLLPNLTHSALVEFVGSRDDPPALFKFAKRVSEATQKKQGG